MITLKHKLPKKVDAFELPVSATILYEAEVYLKLACGELEEYVCLNDGIKANFGSTQVEPVDLIIEVVRKLPL